MGDTFATISGEHIGSCPVTCPVTTPVIPVILCRMMTCPLINRRRIPFSPRQSDDSVWMPAQTSLRYISTRPYLTGTAAWHSYWIRFYIERPLWTYWFPFGCHDRCRCPNPWCSCPSFYQLLQGRHIKGQKSYSISDQGVSFLKGEIGERIAEELFRICHRTWNIFWIRGLPIHRTFSRTIYLYEVFDGILATNVF